MNRCRIAAVVTSLSVALLGSSLSGCGSDDTTASGSGGTAGTGGTGASGGSVSAGGSAGTGGTAGTAGSKGGGGGSTGSGGKGGAGGTSGAAGTAGTAGTAGAGGKGGAGGSMANDASANDAADSGRVDASSESSVRDAVAESDARTGDTGTPDNTNADARDVATTDTGNAETTAPDSGADGGTDPCTIDTIACIQSRDVPSDPDATKCSTCITLNGCLDPAQQGGSCEDTVGNAPAACSTALGETSVVTETRVCLRTLKDVFTSQCAVTLQETPCLCGDTDAGMCLAGSAAPTGPLLPIYQCELGTTAPEITANFTIQSFGAGQANALIQCAAAFTCNCF